MSYAGVGMGRAGFGAYEVPYRDDRTGREGVATASTGQNCGDPYALQVMLHWLGFYDYKVDGIVGPKTRAGLVSYGLAKGIRYDPSKPPSGAICQSLMDDHAAYWAAQDGGAPAPVVSNGCPEGTVGLAPYCVAVPASTPQAPAGAACPEGTIGVAPNCFGLPSAPSEPFVPVPHAPPKPIEPPPVQPPPPGQPPPPTANWWAQRSKGEKAVLVGGAAVGTLLLIGMFIKPGRKRAYT